MRRPTTTSAAERAAWNGARQRGLEARRHSSQAAARITPTSSFSRPTNCTPTGMFSAPVNKGSVMAGAPSNVQSVAMIGLPVPASRFGAMPSAAGVTTAS